MLARAADIGSMTLLRLEKGEQSPRLKTLKAVADASGMEAPDLLVEPEFLPGSPHQTGQNQEPLPLPSTY